ncbi:hypothetical protein [Paraburkholderia acidisoli]|uniref:Uncharacterized protein n=1 Tax=Paraburkholderia acidisoli TaxID=2571748 RepID=A0A7Z2GMC7_9BURK|nr:hypothetical protein [Paraburkholderia acidisoli]QGZ64054.1 hypothetical protein FAZ98_20160 [Paraburkholderia acidisoli]
MKDIVESSILSDYWRLNAWLIFPSILRTFVSLLHRKKCNFDKRFIIFVHNAHSPVKRGNSNANRVTPAMNIDIEAKVIRLLQRAAGRRSLVPYHAFHALFAGAVPLRERYEKLEAAAAALCDPGDADYVALLATDSGLPGPDFFTRFRRFHGERYYALLGADRHRTLRLAEKRELANEARERVYAHHARNVGDPAAEPDGEVERL